MSTLTAVQQSTGAPLELLELTLPDPAPHDVLVRMTTTGVCQSQLFWMQAPHPVPMLFGHEGLGVVSATGSAVTVVSAGDTVMVTWLPRVGDHSPGRASIVLPNGTTAWSPNVYTWSQHALVDELYVVPLPPERAGLDAVAVAGCAVVTGAGAVTHAADLVEGETAVVIGAGGVGLCAIAAAKVRGAGAVIAVDVEDDKLELARKMGATDVINSTGIDPVQAIKDLTGGGADYAFDCVATDSTLNQAVDAVRSAGPGDGRGGTVVLVGLPHGPLTLNVGPAHISGNLITGQKTLIGTTAGGASQEDIVGFLDWHDRGLLDLNLLVTDRYRFEDVAQAADDLGHRRIAGRALLGFEA
jgi:S-(hydroxymethyl)glutathione dehydrogenase/alcohol dehydrogenase